MSSLRWLAFAATGALLIIAPSRGAAAGGGGPPCDVREGAPFALSLSALTEPAATEVSATVSGSVDTCPVPTTLKHVQLKTFAFDGSVAEVTNVNDVAVAGGVASVDLPALEHGQRIEAHVQIQTPETVRTVVLRAETEVLRRPDLQMGDITTVTSILSGRSFAVSAPVTELNGDLPLDATARLTRRDTGEPLGTTPIHIPAGGTVFASFSIVLNGSGFVPLELAVRDASVREVTLGNNASATTIEVTSFEVDLNSSIVDVLAGYGGQFNHSLFYKPLNPIVPPGAPALEEKLDTLEPQLARVFFPNLALSQLDRLDSFKQVVHMAQDAGAIINVTWQSGSSNIDSNMSRFAAILRGLVVDEGVTNLRWVTLLNEPNSTAVSFATYERMYRSLDGFLRAEGVRDHIRFMGGDLVQDGQREWLQYMADHMADILDAYSIHVFWDFWDTAKIESRLTDVQAIRESLQPEARKPVYVAEYGVRGIRRPDGPGTPQVPEPGVWFDRTVMSQTNVSAFQLGWFNILASRLGYPGTMVWDLFNAKYDSGTQDFSCIGPAPDFTLRPCYFGLRLFTATTEPGWRVVQVEGAAASQLLTAYAGDESLVTVVGLDRAGAQLNDGSGTPSTYSVGGLPPLTSFRLVVWNETGTGALASDRIISTDAAGVAWLTIPTHAIWSLTTHPVTD
jgi:hypothetical protein